MNPRTRFSGWRELKEKGGYKAAPVVIISNTGMISPLPPFTTVVIVSRGVCLFVSGVGEGQVRMFVRLKKS